MGNCYLCDTDAEDSSVPLNGNRQIVCPRCGKYVITEDVIKFNKPGIRKQGYILSAATRRASDSKKSLTIKMDNIDELIHAVRIPQTPMDILDQLLLLIYERLPMPPSLTQSCTLSELDSPLFVLKSRGDMTSYLHKLQEMGYVKINQVMPPKDMVEYICNLTLDGWKRITELGKIGVRSQQCFVAMWFSDDLKPAWDEGFYPGIKDIGFNPVRADTVEHNEKICDRIMSDIRQSGLLVADFTGHRGGVYFEAGFALGLGIPVIFTVREDSVDGLHFDTRQYNHIIWKDPSDLRRKISDRILATIPVRTQ